MFLSLNNPTKKDKQMTDGWERLELKFEDIPDTVRQPVLGGYCSNYLNGGSRARNEDDKKPTGIERYGGKESVLILDIDDHITIPMAKDIFEKYKCIIVTTKSHKQTHHKFRVFIKLTRDIDDYYERLKIMEYIYKTYPFIDQACKNCNRLFYTSPEDAEYYKFLDGVEFDIDEILSSNEQEMDEIQQNDHEPIPLPNQEFKTVKWAGMTFKVLVKNTEEEEYYDGEIDEEAKLRGIQTFLEDEYYQGQKSNTLFRASAMMINDGFSEEFIEDYLISYWHSKSSSTDRMRDAQQNIRGAFKLR